MKFKPAHAPGGLVVELGPDETGLPASAALPVFQLKKILVPVDFSERSKKALQYALPLARQFGAQLIMLHVVQPIPIPEMATEDVGSLQNQLGQTARKEIDALRRTVSNEVVCQNELRVGDPHTEIISAAKDLSADLIILSTHGRTGLAHVFLGSTTERVVRHAHCPVLVVREQERDFVSPFSHQRRATV